MPEPTTTHVAELVDPMSGETVELIADTEIALDSLIQQHLDRSFPTQ